MSPASPHVVYRAIDASGVLLYVGCTHNLSFRLREHRRTKAAWLPSVARIDEELHPDRSSALEAERRAIVLERPVHNVAYRNWHPDQVAAPGESAEERAEARYAEACASMGLTHVWDSLTTATPTERMVRNIFGAVILGAVEMSEPAVTA